MINILEANVPKDLRAAAEGFLTRISTTSKTRHDLGDCQNPHHIAIKLGNGRIVCGPGGFWPDSGEGVVYSPLDNIHYKGQLVRDNSAQRK